MRLNYNIPALTMSFVQDKALKSQSSSLERISSGYKITSAKDDPSAFVQSENIRLQIGGLKAASRNAQDGVSMLQTAEGGMQEITSMVQRIRQLTVQAGDASLTDEDKAIIQNEIDQMLDGINDVANNTEFNTFKLLKSSGEDGKEKSINIQVGANSGESVTITQMDMTESSSDSFIKGLYELRTGGENSILKGDIGNSLDAIDNAMNTITSIRSQYGALENRFQSSYENIQELKDEMTDADSSIRDADISKEIMNYSTQDIIVQASNAMIAQTNKLPQDILQILSTYK
jgi:flagellin